MVGIEVIFAIMMFTYFILCDFYFFPYIMLCFSPPKFGYGKHYVWKENLCSGKELGIWIWQCEWCQKKLHVYNICFFFLFVEDWEGNQRSSRWCYCTSQGEKILLCSFWLSCRSGETTSFPCPNALPSKLHPFYFLLICLTHFAVYLFHQESPMPDPSELFTNVYVKGYGIEVNVMPFLFIH